MKKLFLSLIVLMLPTLAYAQNNTRNPCYYLTPTSTNCQPVSSTTPLPVTTTPGNSPQAVQGAVNVTPVNCSGTITTGGTAQNAVVASTTRRGLQIQNLDTTEGMWISFNGTAAANDAGSFFLSAATSSTSGGSYNTPIGFGFNTALSVVAATTGHKFSCTQW